MQSFENVSTIIDHCRSSVDLGNGALRVTDPESFRETVLDRLVYSAVFGDDDVKAASRWLIWQAGLDLGAIPSSIHDYYIAGGAGAWSNQTTPAINVRGITYDTARAVVRAAQRMNSKQFIFEIARSEIGYTAQRPEEYATVVLAAAIRERHTGPVFIQGDHFQVNVKNFAADPAKEVNGVKDLIVEAIQAGFYNIDVDTSTLVDLSKPTEAEQQVDNYIRCAELTAFIRDQQPDGIMISVGGEIGEVGSENSTVEDLHAFMEGYVKQLAELGDIVGISKISVQTGTKHGGTVLPDGTIADVSVDFETLGALSAAARDDYSLAGAVQHGASTLPEIAFNRFAEANACEVHLATGFQNIIYDSEAFPADLRDEIYAHLAKHHDDERKPDMSDAQFYYTTRKRGFGPFKQQMWDLSPEIRGRICEELEAQFMLIFERLGVANTAELVDQHTTLVKIERPAPEVLQRIGV